MNERSHTVPPPAGGIAIASSTPDLEPRNYKTAVVRVLADDAKTVKSLCAQLKSAGYRSASFSSLEALFSSESPPAPACLVMACPLANGTNCLQVLESLRQHGWTLPLVILSARWDLKSVVKAIKAGAEDFLATPVSPDDFLNAVEQALQRSERQQQQLQCAADASQRVASLNERELEILKLVLAGMLNKEIADQLNLALVTIKVYRARVMKKLGAGNAASMACIASLAGLDVKSSLSFND